MAKSNANPELTLDDLANIINGFQQQLDSFGKAIKTLSDEVGRLGPLVDQVRNDIVQIAPLQHEVPPELLTAVTPAMVYQSALTGIMLGMLQIAGPSKTAEQYESMLKRFLPLAETAYRLMAEKVAAHQKKR